VSDTDVLGLQVELPPVRQTISTKDVKVTRVVVTTSPVDYDYSRVELVIDGETYDMPNDAAQILGATLNRAAGGTM
jgi:hypothetical protein